LAEATSTGNGNKKLVYRPTRPIDFKRACLDVDNINKQGYYWFDLNAKNMGRDNATGEVRLIDCAERDFVFLKQGKSGNVIRSERDRIVHTLRPRVFHTIDRNSKMDIRTANMFQSFVMLYSMFECTVASASSPLLHRDIRGFGRTPQMPGSPGPSLGLQGAARNWILINVLPKHREIAYRLIFDGDALYKSGIPIPSVHEMIDWKKAQSDS
jgi:hypothetical protein